MQDSSALTTSPLGQLLPPGVVISSRGRRLGATLLDIGLSFVLLGIGWIVWFIITCQEGQTPGKKLLGMRIVSTQTGRAFTGWMTLFREILVKGIIGSITFGIAYLWILWDKDRQALYDKVVNANVVNDPNGLTLGSAMSAPSAANF